MIQLEVGQQSGMAHRLCASLRLGSSMMRMSWWSWFVDNEVNTDPWDDFNSELCLSC